MLVDKLDEDRTEESESELSEEEEAASSEVLGTQSSGATSPVSNPGVEYDQNAILNHSISQAGQWLRQILEEEVEEEEENLNETTEEEEPGTEMAELETITDPATLRRLVREARGENKVFLRESPPSLDDCKDYEVYKAKISVWKNTTAFSDKQQAGAVIGTIMDDHKNFKKGLQTDMMRTFTEDQLQNPTMKMVMDFLDKHLAGNKVESVYNAYNDFIQCEMEPGEKYEDFVMRFDVSYTVLQQTEKDIKIPDKILTMQLLKAAKLEKATLIAVRSNIKWDDNDVYEKTKTAINRICHGEVNRGSKVAQVKLATEDGTYDISREGGCFVVNGEKMIKQSEAQVMLSDLKTKIDSKSQRGGPRGRRAGGRGGHRGGRGGRGGADRQDTRTCWICGKVGHLQSNCPEAEDDDEGDEAKLVGHSAWVTEVHGGTEEQVILDDNEIWGVLDGEEETEHCYVGLNPKQSKTFTQEAAGAMALDSCCSRTLCGQQWLEQHKKMMPADMRKQLKGPMPSNVTFTFGDGKTLKSKGKYIVPVIVYGVKAKLVAELVDSDIPLLVSKNAMEKCGVVLNFADKKTTAFGITRRMVETSLGHPIVGVLPKTPAPFEEELLMAMGHTSEEVMAVRDIKLGKNDNKKLPRKQQVEVIKKVHKQAGHQSKEKFLKFLQNSSIEWDKGLLREELDKLSKNCVGCILKKRKPDKPAACIPVADGFNQCVGMDLKIYPDGVILYVIDMWSKLIQGRFVKSKRPEDIIEALLKMWICPFGCFDRCIHDNGGEFIAAAFEEMMDLLGIQDGTTGAHSPWSAGIVEKHHAMVDATYESLRREYPHYKRDVLLQWAVYVKNSTPGATGWSSYQVVYGKNPKMPCLMTSNIAGLREEVLTQELLENVNALQQARIEFNKALADNTLKKMVKSKVRRNNTVFYPGDYVYWRTHENLDKWRNGKVLCVDGKVMWVRAGSRVRRVSTDMVIKVNTEFDKTGELVDTEDDEREQVEEIRRVQRRKRVRKQVKFDIAEQDGEQLGDVPRAEGIEPHLPDDQPGDDGAGGEDEEDSSAPPRQNYGNERALSGLGGASPQVSPATNSGLATNSNLSGNNDDAGDESAGDEEITSAELNQAINEPEPPVTDNEARETMIRMEMQQSALRKETSVSKDQFRLDLKKKDVIVHDGQICDVGDRLGKRGRNGRIGKNYNTFNLFPRSGAQPYSVDLSRSEYQKLDNVQQAGQQEQVLVLKGEECHMDIVPYKLHGNQECMEAKRQEVKKIVEDYKAVKVVPDDGHYKISSRFVLWYKKHSDGSVQTRARLVARGFEEKEEVASDSPTMDSTSLKIIFMTAQHKNWKVTTADVKAAFLQGLPLKERTVRVIPPPEANVPAGYVWELEVALYGLQDASLRFHWKVCKVFKELEMKQSRLDPAVFYARDKKTGRLKGIIGTHVDDFLITGEQSWLDKITKEISQRFELGKIEDGDFLYCGHRIIQQGEKITLGQEEFAAEVKPFEISPARKRQPAEKVTEKERAQMRSGAGKLGWMARLTRPDLMFAQIEASSNVTRAEVSDLKQLNKAIIRVADTKSELNIPKLKTDVTSWKIQLFTDAAWQNLNQVGSTGGRVVFISDGKSSFPVHWASHRLRRVCHSSQAAEIMAMNEGLNDTAFIRQMIHEITDIWVPIQLTIDNKNAYRAITGTTAPTDKKVRCEAAGVRESLLEGEVERVRLVRGKAMLADVLTKRKVEPNDLLHIVQTSESLDKLGY